MPRNALAVTAMRWWLGLIVSCCALFAAAPATAADAPKAPPGDAVADYWREVRQGVPGLSQVPGAERGVMINARGETWRQQRNGPLKRYGGMVLLAMLGIIVLFYLVKGPMKLSEPPTGRKIQRFTPFERFVHWGTAITFILMGLTGLAILFGRTVLGPLIGTDGLGGLLALGKLVHNYLGPLFLAFTILLIFAFVRDNVWQKCDGEWIAKAGGMFSSGAHVPSGRFNFGEKTWFWLGVTFLGLFVAGTGLLLNFPALIDRTRDLMQNLVLLHAIGAVLLLALSFGHIYMGTVGVEGALDSMKTGEVDETWAREHHALWYEDVKAGRSGRP
ncbi:MAG: formate dehydrogenase subunit gamma [Zoogloeaceae bacterium]|nr:formate dehydrogenase subunit gamma [Rhodocyclaceae bacterium]MCP5236678.1 formate dehydrogenase subunit gamma [Zoogloeaceae bacterium]